MISNFVLNTYTNIIFCQSDDKSKYDCAYIGFVNVYTAITTDGNILN